MVLKRVLKCICMAVGLVVLLALICSDLVLAEEDGNNELVVLTVNGSGTDAQKRLLRNAETFAYEIRTLGDDRVVDSETELKQLRDAVAKLSSEKKNRLLLFVDGPDVVLASGPLRIVEEFDMSEAGILVSADGIYKGEKSLKAEFPQVEKGKRFLNAGAFVGNTESIQALLKEFSDAKSLQEILSSAYLKPSLRKKYNIKIDHASTLFQNLNGATADLELRFIGKETYLQNILTRTVPAVIRADEQTRTVLNTYGSYLARAWNVDDGCRECWEDMISLEEVEDSKLPMVTLAIFIEKPTPFMEEFLETIDNMAYPRDRMHLFLHNGMEFHKNEILAWLDRVKGSFSSVKHISFEDSSMKEWHAKNAAIDYCLDRECTHIFFVDGDARVDNPHALKLLMEQNRRVVAPMLPRPGKAWSNFWGSLTADGFYARSDDYMEIVQNERRGLWNVPYVSSSYLLKRELLEDPKTKPSFVNNLLDPDMAFCQNLREKGIFLYVSNRVDFGHLVSSENFNIENFNPNLWQLIENRWDWEKRYLHPNYSQSLNESNKIQMPCPDVYWFPVFTERYAKEMIELMENYGQWSDGSHMENYRDNPVQASLSDVKLDKIWQEFVSHYISPIQMRVFVGYVRSPPRALMSFTVRYRPDEQPFLRPHHDTSTYTINVGLNRPRIDFQGGGCRFVRYNCSVVDTRVGWMLMHPGRLTHLHEGLRVTGGTRYIIVTFVDP